MAGDGWLPLSERPEWSDVTPLPQEEPSVPVVSIRYSNEDREGLEMLRAVMHAEELSKRALALTKEVIEINPACYPAWEYRWKCLLANSSEILEEPAFLDSMAAGNAKNYQLWNHRRKLALHRGSEYAHEELEFVRHCLTGDAKNYHAWAHRQLVVAAFGAWGAEMEYTAELLEEDVRNNSAWNHRHFVIASAPQLASATGELEFVCGLILECPHNESAWVYLRGLFALPCLQGRLAFTPEVSHICLQVLEDSPSCSYAWGMLADVYEAQSQAASAGSQPEVAAVASGNALHCFQQLLVADPMRTMYWQHRMLGLSEDAQG